MRDCSKTKGIYYIVFRLCLGKMLPNRSTLSLSPSGECRREAPGGHLRSELALGGGGRHLLARRRPLSTPARNHSRPSERKKYRNGSPDAHFSIRVHLEAEAQEGNRNLMYSSTYYWWRIRILGGMKPTIHIATTLFLAWAPPPLHFLPFVLGVSGSGGR